MTQSWHAPSNIMHNVESAKTKKRDRVQPGLAEHLILHHETEQDARLQGPKPSLHPKP